MAAVEYGEISAVCERMCKEASYDAVIVLGGDGTLIQVAGSLPTSLPLIGINFGKLGFLAEVAKDEIFEALDKLIADEFNIENRMMLSAKSGDYARSALNDIVIAREGELRIVSFSLYVNGILLNKYEADGIIVSTPTGSTGYSMSAGGPIVEPGAELILVTPIAPHTLNSRTIVLSAEDNIRIMIGKGRIHKEHEAYVSCDGGKALHLSAGDYVDIKRTDAVTKIIKLRKESFIDVLSRKMQ